ncbi:MAG TPA: hypothetical protein DEH11_02905 [Actinobacteria bacterium]|jgi:NitT/TauT family transport system substrate-binding protein|nr:hypothetical protein [Actinomycetota bacterium]
MRLVRAGARLSALRLTLALALIAILASACGSSANAGSPGSQTITVAVVPGPGNAPLYVAVRDGLFSQHGLTVHIKRYPALAPVVRALRSGQAQVAAGDYTDFFYEQANNQLSLRLVADGYDATPNMTEILTLPNSKITSPQALEGATVASPEPQVITATGSLPYDIETLAAQAVLESDGVSPTSVKWKPTPAQDMISELRNGQVSAILATEPYVLKAESQVGAQELIDANSGVASALPQLGYFSLSSYALGHSATVSEFRTVLFQAQAASSMRGPIQRVLPKATGMSASDAALITLGAYPTYLSVGQVQRVAQLMFEAGVTDNLLNVKGLVAR